MVHVWEEEGEGSEGGADGGRLVGKREGKGTNRMHFKMAPFTFWLVHIRERCWGGGQSRGEDEMNKKLVPLMSRGAGGRNKEGGEKR